MALNTINHQVVFTTSYTRSSLAKILRQIVIIPEVIRINRNHNYLIRRLFGWLDSSPYTVANGCTIDYSGPTCILLSMTRVYKATEC